MNKLTHFFKSVIGKIFKKDFLKMDLREDKNTNNLDLKDSEKKETEFDVFFKAFLKMGDFDSATKMLNEGYLMHENVKNGLDKAIYYVAEEITNTPHKEDKESEQPIIIFDKLSKVLSHEAFLKFMIDNKLVNGSLIDKMIDKMNAPGIYMSDAFTINYNVDLLRNSGGKLCKPGNALLLNGMFPYLDNDCIFINQLLYSDFLTENEKDRIDGYPEYSKIAANPFLYKLMNHPYLFGTKLFMENNPDITLEQAFELTKKHVNNFVEEEEYSLQVKHKINYQSIKNIKYSLHNFSGIEKLSMTSLYSMYLIHQSFNKKIEEFGQGKLEYFVFLMNEAEKEGKTKKIYHALSKMILLESPERIFGNVSHDEIKRTHLSGGFPVSLACVLDNLNLSYEMLKKLEEVNLSNPENIKNKVPQEAKFIGPDINHVLNLLKKSKRENIGALNDLYELLDKYHLNDLEHDLKEVSTILKELNNHQLNPESRNYISNVETEILAMFDTYNAIQEIDESGHVTSKEMVEIPLKSIVMKLQDIKREILAEQIESLQKTVVVAKKVQAKR